MTDKLDSDRMIRRADIEQRAGTDEAPSADPLPAGLARCPKHDIPLDEDGICTACFAEAMAGHGR
jgi:hypothetical protein